ncbi:hypothetical protein AB4Y43_18750 [Paraburkholderia sp. BR10872]|uniref:hypothetical protein n=1 Tax=Paraburkholderia sp. BR10872 TaxID=3236989 RepID=UPI0034D2D0C9
MSDYNLFGGVDALRESLRKLEAGCVDTASAMRTRITAQERAIPELRRFGHGIDVKQYSAARELVTAVVAGTMGADRLEVLLMALELEFVKRKVPADRSRSNKRFDQFWETFDALVRGRRCSSPKDAHMLTCARVPPPHAALSMARDRYRVLREEMGLT